MPMLSDNVQWYSCFFFLDTVQNHCFHAGALTQCFIADSRGGNLRDKDTDEYSSSDDDETADQKRKRLAQEHLEKLKAYGQ